jgi:integrase
MRVPRLRRHTTGQATARIGGKDFYFGFWRTPEAKKRYESKIAEWIAQGRPRFTNDTPSTIGQVMATYWQWAEQRYAASPTELRDIRHSLRELRQLYEQALVSQFGIASLETIRQAMISRGHTRQLINQRIGRIKRLFHWAAQRQLIPTTLWMQLQLLHHLREGESHAIESKPVTAVPQEIVNQTLQHVSPTVACLARLQQWTGMRPGEVCRMTWRDIDSNTDPWIYRVKFKRKWRMIPLGRRSQFLLSWRKSNCQDSEPIFLTHRGNPWSVTAYDHEIAKACSKAQVPHWHPHQLRHSVATTIQAMEIAGLQNAGASLGHNSAQITQRYAHAQLEIAIAIAKQLG